jgi:hypothetical protein
MRSRSSLLRGWAERVVLKLTEDWDTGYFLFWLRGTP